MSDLLRASTWRDGRTPPQRRFQYGLRAAKDAPALMLADILKTGVKVPPHADLVDYLAPFSNWQVLGNQWWGDCVSVMCDNYTRLVTGTLGIEYYGTQAEVIAFYKTQNPRFVPDINNPVQDDGMDIQTALEYWHAHTVFGRQLVAFAKVDVTNLVEIQAAIDIFGGLLLGCDVQGSQQTQFANGLPWDYVAGDPIEGGHGIPAGGYNALTPARDVDFVTWGAQTVFTDNFWVHLMREAWVAILPEHLGSARFQAGVSLDQLVEYYADVTNGKVLPIPAPAPGPTPIPTPTPLPNGCSSMVADGLDGLAAKVRGTGTSALAARVTADGLAALAVKVRGSKTADAALVADGLAVSAAAIRKATTVNVAMLANSLAAGAARIRKG